MLSKVHDFSETKRWHQECRVHGDLPISVDISSLEMAECCHNCLGYPWIFISLGYIMTSCEWTFSNQQILWKGYMYNYIIYLLWYMYINDKIYDMYFLKHAIYDYIIYRVKLLLFRIFYVFMYRDCLMVIVSVGCLIRSSSIRSSPQQQAEWWVGREPCLETAIFHFFPSHLIVRHFIHLIHFILFTSLKSKHPVRRCLGTCLTHSKTGRRDWNIRVHSFSLISCSFASVSFTSFSFTSVSFTSFFFISFTNTKRLEKTKNSLVGVVVVGADGWWELMERHLDFTNLFSTATTRNKQK